MVEWLIYWIFSILLVEKFLGPKFLKFWKDYNLRNIYQNPHLIKLLVWKRYQAAIEFGLD